MGFPPGPLTVDLATVQYFQLSFLTNFAGRMSTLESIATKERSREPLSLEETDFLKNIVGIVVFYTNYRQWNGWYPGLFIRTCSFIQQTRPNATFGMRW
jgi:hypothetical protein